MDSFKETKIAGEEKFRGNIFYVTFDQVLLPDGNKATREVARYPGASAIVAVNEKDEVALVRQYRYAMGREMIEIPAGIRDPEDMNPMQTAVRELEEEAGVVAKSWHDLGLLVPSCGASDEEIYIYYAKELTQTQQHLDDTEFLSVMWLPFEEAVDLVMQGKIADSKATSGLLRAKILRDKGEL